MLAHLIQFQARRHEIINTWSSASNFHLLSDHKFAMHCNCCWKMIINDLLTACYCVLLWISQLVCNKIRIDHCLHKTRGDMKLALKKISHDIVRGAYIEFNSLINKSRGGRVREREKWENYNCMLTETTL